MEGRGRGKKREGEDLEEARQKRVSRLFFFKAAPLVLLILLFGVKKKKRTFPSKKIVFVSFFHDE